MKKILLISLFIISSIISYGQTIFDFGPSNYGSFQYSGEAKCGEGNAYCTITRSQYPNNFGNYIYQVYFSTNSYFDNCVVSKTYIPDIEVLYFDGTRWVYPKNYYKFWVSVDNTSLAYTLFHPSPSLYMKIKTGFMEPSIY